MSQESKDSNITSPSVDNQSEPMSVEIAEEKVDLLGKKEREMRELNDKYVRLIAEFENFKKRSSRDQLENLKYAHEPVLREILPIIDNLERAYYHSKESQDIQKLIEGLQLILKQSQEILSKLGVVPITAKGEAFDPMKHQAISQTETDEIPENHVVDEISKGYLFKDRVLRPSMVSVSKRKNA
jgi:molecular chaperone GrpE